MLSLQENYILNLFIDVYEMNLKNQVIRSNKNLNIIFDENHVPNRIIDMFFNKVSKDVSFILYLSIMYAIGFSEAAERMKNYIEYYKQNINNPANLNIEFKRMCTYNTIKYLILKKNNKVSLIREEECFNKYNTYFQYIENLKIIYSLRDFEKNILFKLLEKHNPINVEEFILEVINTNKFDKEIIDISNNFIDNKQINFFKSYLIRIIFMDAYILHTKIVKDKEKELFIIPFFNSSNAGVMTPELAHINNCIVSKKFLMPSHKIQCLNIIKAFLICLDDPEYKKENLDEMEKVKKKELSIIDPLYKLG